MPKKILKDIILKKLNEYNIDIQVSDESNEIFSITCNNYMIHVIDNRVNINFSVYCWPIESAKIILILNQIKGIDIHIGYIYDITKSGKLLIGEKAKESFVKKRCQEMSDIFVKDFYEKNYLINNQIGSC